MQLRRIAGIAALGAAASLFIAPTAGAQEVTEQYAAQSSGQALRLEVFGNELTVGKTIAGLDSTVAAAANGTGVATPLFEGGITSAQANGEGTDGSAEEVCEGNLDQIPGLSLAFACSSSLAQVTGGVPSSTSTGRVSDIKISPIRPLLDTELSAVVGPVEEAVDQLVTGLSAITGPIDENLDLGLQDTLETVFDRLFSGADLVSIELGETVATATKATGVASTCAAEGGRIDILDPTLIDAGLEPVMSILIGDASTSVTLDAAGAPTFTAQPAIATVLVPTMGVNLAIGPGDSVEIPLPEPFGSSTIAVAHGATGVNEAGQQFARADAVFLDLLNGEAMQGGVELSIAGCMSVAGLQQTPVPPSTTTPPRCGDPGMLPCTGGGALGSPVTLVLASGLGLLGIGLLRRTATSGV